MKCNLCLKEYEKLAKSHIIPEFEYKRNGLFEGGKGGMFDLQTGRIINSQKGEYERLLCVDCEGRMNKQYESYARRLFYDGSEPKINFSWEKIEDPKFGTLFQYSKVHYHKLKSYLLLNLWRANISSRPFFSRVSLSGERIEKMRVNLLNNLEFEEDDFGISMHTFQYSLKIPPTIIQPATANNLSIFLIGKTFYMYHDDKTKFNEETLRLTPKKSGEFAIQVLREETVVSILNKYHGIDFFKL